MSQADFASRLGVTGAGISKIESGQRNLTDQMILLICKEFNVNENWLRYGTGDIYQKESPDCLEQLVLKYSLNEFDKNLIYEYAKLDEKKRAAIKEYVLNISSGFSDN